MTNKRLPQIFTIITAIAQIITLIAQVIGIIIQLSIMQNTIEILSK